MGRGRAKAKQAKVARQLKYSGAGTDLDALRKELVGEAPSSGGGVDVDEEYDDDLDYDADGYDADEDESDDDSDDLGPSYGASGRR
jgi:hypothetical protein